VFAPLFPKEARWVRVRGGTLGGYDIYVKLRCGPKSYRLGVFEPKVQLAIRTLANGLSTVHHRPLDTVRDSDAGLG
jgi:hypothetical protein